MAGRNGPPRPETERGRASPVPGVSGGRLLERATVIDAVVAEIKGKIISGELKDGDVLASQDELARNLGVSRASLREALNRLSLMGLIEMKHGSGTFVRTSQAQDYMNPLTSMLIMDVASAEELLQARLYIESGLAALAAANASDEDIQLMGALVKQMRLDAEADDSAGFVDRDARFHVVLAESARNPVLMKVAEIIRELLPAFITRFRTAFPQRVPAVVEQHARVYEAVRDRNPEAARRAMEEHMSFLMQLNREGAESH